MDPLAVYPGVFGEGVDVGVLAVGGLGLSCRTTNLPSGQAASSEGYVDIKGNLYVHGDFFTDIPGQKHAAIPHPDGTHRALCALECPESWLEDFGRAKLRDGRREVAIDPDFAALVETDDYHVFLTPEGDSRGLYVNARTSTAFEVREQADGKSTLSFSYRIVARPKDIDHERLAVVEIPPTREWKAPELEPLDQEPD